MTPIFHRIRTAQRRPQHKILPRKEPNRVKAENALVPVYRKELRKVLLENLQWMRAMKKDPILKKLMET